jgi:hypothetical protein
MLRMQRAVAFVVMLLGCWTAPAAVPLEELKAAFLYNFALFVEWPTPPQGEFNLCLYGAGPFEAANSLAGKKVGGATVQIRRPAKAEDLRSCHMLYIGGSDRNALERARTAVEKAPVLTVADAVAGSENLAMISLVAENSRLTFDIDMHAASRVGIRISSRLLRLARKVY